MAKECIISASAPPAVGPYSHAVRAGGLFFISGQGPLARNGSGLVRAAIEEETRLALENLKVILEESGLALENVVKTTVYLAEMVNFGRFNDVYKTYFPKEPPARTCVQAARLPLDMQVEIEAIAVM